MQYTSMPQAPRILHRVLNCPYYAMFHIQHTSSIIIAMRTPNEKDFRV